MTATQTKYEFGPFCYEHHIKMDPNQTLPPRTENGRTQGITFACPAPGCLVLYNGAMGYFMLEPCPCVKCEKDGAPMYLSEYFPERPSLRLWKCPLCKTVRANGEASVGSQEEPPQKEPPQAHPRQERQTRAKEA